jgi:hypothetical protein
VNECGECKFWITPQCPREGRGDGAGLSQGPAAKDLACAMFLPRRTTGDPIARLPPILDKLPEPKED